MSPDTQLKWATKVLKAVKKEELVQEALMMRCKEYNLKELEVVLTLGDPRKWIVVRVAKDLKKLKPQHLRECLYLADVSTGESHQEHEEVMRAIGQ